MSSAETALKGVGVAINDLEGNVKPVNGIIDELGKKWHSLSDEQQQNTAVSVAGRYQLSRFLALMNNYGLAIDATETAMNSQNSAMSEQEKYADSLEGRINRLDTAWNQFTLSVGEAVMTDGLIVMVESLGDLTKVASAVVDTTGALPPLFGMVGIAVTLLSTKLKGFATALIFGTSSMTRSQLVANGLTSSMTTLGIATTGARTALMGLASATVIGLVFVGVGVALEKVIGLMGDAKQAQEDYEKSQKTSVEAITVNKDETDKLISSYKRLSEASKNGGLDTEKEKEYLEVQQKLGELFPALVDGMSSTGELRLKSASLIDNEIEATERLVELKREELKLNAQDNFKDRKAELDGLFGLENQVKSTQKALDSMVKSGASESAINEYKQRLFKEQSELATAVSKINDQILSLSEAYNDFEISPSIANQVSELVSSLDVSNLNPSQLESYAVSLAFYTDEMERAIEKNSEESFEIGKQKLIDQAKAAGATEVALSAMNITFDDVIKKNKELAEASYGSSDGTEVFEDSLEGLNGTTEEAVETMDEYIAKLRELESAEEQVVGTSQGQIDAVDDLLYVYQSLVNQSSLSEAQTLSLADAQAKLSAIYPHLVENGTLRIDKIMEENEAQRILLNSVKLSKEGKLSAEDEMTLSSALGTKARIDNLKKEMEAMLLLFNQYMDEANRLANANAGLEADLDAEEAFIKAQKFKNFEMNKTPYKDATAKLNGYIAELNTSTGALAKSTAYQDEYSKSTDKASKSTKNAAKDSIYFTDKYKNSVESLTLALEKQNAIKAKYPTHSKEHQKAIKSEIALTEQLKKATEDQAKSLEAQIKSGKIAPTGMVTTTSGGSKSNNNSSSKASGNSTEANIWNFFKSKGLTDSASAGIMGNLKLESGLSTTAVNKSSGATGIAQWLGGRLSGLKAYAKTLGTSWTDLNTQLEWLWKELNGADSTTKSILNKNGGLDALNNMNASSAALLFEKAFERSGGAALTQRKNNANGYYGKYSGTGSSASYDSSSDESSEESATTKAAQINQAIDQARSELNGLNGDIIGYQEKLDALKLELITAELDTFDYQRQQYQNTLNFEEAKQDAISSTSKEFRASIDKQITAMEGQQSANQNELNYLNALIKNGKLSSVVMTQMKDRVYALKTEMLQLGTAIQNANFEKIESRITAYDEDYDNLDHLVGLTKEYLNTLEQGSPEYIAESKNLIASMEKQKRATRNEIEELKEKLITQDLTVEKTKQLKERLEDLTTRYWSLTSGIKSTTKALEDSNEAMGKEIADKLIDSYKEVVEAQSEAKERQLDAELEALEESHNAQMDFYDDQIEAENKSHEAKMENLQKQMDAYEKYIQDQIEGIDRVENTRTYDKDIDGLQKEKNEIQKALNELLGDDSYEAKAKKKDLNKQLADIDDQLFERRNSREIELRKENYEDLLETEKEKFEAIEKNETEIHENRLENLENLKEAEQDVYDARVKQIENSKKYWSQYYTDLANDERKFAKIRKDIVAGNFSEIEAEFQGHLDYLISSMPELENTLDGTMKAVGTSIRLNLIDNLKEAMKLMNDFKTDKTTPATNNPQLNSDKNVNTPNSPDNIPSTMSGKITITKPINLWKRKRGSDEMTEERILQPGEKYTVYGYENKYGGQYDVGGGYWITNMKDHIKFASADVGGQTSNWSGSGVDGKGGRSMIVHPNEIINNPLDSERLLSAASLMDKVVTYLPKFLMPKVETNVIPNNNESITIQFNVDKMTGNDADVKSFNQKIANTLKRERGMRR